jgi:uncharacterized protein YkwD
MTLAAESETRNVRRTGIFISGSLLLLSMMLVGCSKESLPTSPSAPTTPPATSTPPAVRYVTVFGVVTNEVTNAAVGGVTVSITAGNGTSGRSVTDGNGYYSIPAVAAGSMTFDISAPNYNGQRMTETVNGDMRRDVRLAPLLSDLEAELMFCVTETNRYRATLQLPPLTRSSALEAFAAEGAREDGLAHSAHQHFRANPGIAFAENVIPWWKRTSVRAVTQEGLAMMWAEGPGGGHHENMRGRYTQLGCGVFVNGNEITVVQDFR